MEDVSPLPDEWPAENEKFILKLFITGASQNSAKAISNIREVCEEHLKGNYELEIIDVYQQPVNTIHEQIIAIPLLVRYHPLPKRKLIGDLSDTERVLHGLGIVK